MIGQDHQEKSRPGFCIKLKPRGRPERRAEVRTNERITASGAQAKRSTVLDRRWKW